MQLTETKKLLCYFICILRISVNPEGRVLIIFYQQKDFVENIMFRQKNEILN